MKLHRLACRFDAGS